MKIYTHIIGEEPFEKWAESHADCEKLILKGTIKDDVKGDEHRKYDSVIFNMTHLRIVNIDELNIVYQYNTEEEAIDYNMIFASQDVSYFDYDFSLGILGRMVLNKDYSNDFSVSAEDVRSIDGKVLVWIKPQEEISIPFGIEIIGRYTCFSFEDLCYLKIPDTVKVIEDYAFHQSNLSATLTLPDSIIRLGKYSFADCDIDNIIFPNNIKIIPEGCFSGVVIFDIVIPPSVTEIQDFAFGYCFDITVPEGVKKIGNQAFPHAEEIDLPSTLEFLDTSFYEDEDNPPECNPYIRVNPDNPWFYAIDGTLYKRGQEEPYLGFIYEEKKPPQLVFFPETKDKEYSVEEVLSDYPENNIKPINSEKTLFWVYMPFLGINIIDRSKHQYLSKKMINNVSFIFEGAIMLTDKEYNHHIYSNNLKELLISDRNTSFSIYDFDEEGRVYIEENEPIDHSNFFPFKPSPVKQWCIRYDGTPILNQKYEGLGKFSKEGIATAKLNKRWGMINLNEDILIPFEYHSLKKFNNLGWAEAKKGKKTGYIDRNNNIVIPFKYDFFYHSFDHYEVAIAFIREGNKEKAIYIDRNNQILGIQDMDISPEGLWEKKFHIFKLNGKYGYCLQFGYDFSGCRYKAIEIITPNHIRISEDGETFTELSYSSIMS